MSEETDAMARLGETDVTDMMCDTDVSALLRLLQDRRKREEELVLERGFHV